MIKTQPNTQQQHRNVMKPAFTLLEILTVIAIIAVLASLTIGGMGYYDQKMKYSRTEILIASIERALEDYKVIMVFILREMAKLILQFSFILHSMATAN